MSTRNSFIMAFAVCFLTVSTLPASAAIISATAGTFSGGDPSDGLDLYADAAAYPYALNFGNPSPSADVTIGNFTFKPVKVSAAQILPTGVTVTAPSGNDAPDYPSLDGVAIDYGATTPDNNLEGVMKATSYASSITITLDLTGYAVGSPYELQVLASDNFGAGARPIKFTVDGTATTLVAFDPQALILAAGGYTGASHNPITKGAVATIFGTTTGSTLTVQLDANGGNVPVISGLTLAILPEPTSMSLLGLGALALLLRRRAARITF